VKKFKNFFSEFKIFSSLGALPLVLTLRVTPTATRLVKLRVSPIVETLEL